jgi:hypothetical protein
MNLNVRGGDKAFLFVGRSIRNLTLYVKAQIYPKYDLGIEVKYIWELVADSLIIEPWNEEEVEKAHALRDAQYERDEIVLDEPEE